MKNRGYTDRYLHESCAATMLPNPKDSLMPPVRYVSPGVTFNVGRNKAKRARRALKQHG